MHSDSTREVLAVEVLDALAMRIAVVDREGTIILVNQAWREGAARRGPEAREDCEGANYLDQCEDREGSATGPGPEFAAGVREVLHGGRDSFTLDYPCHSSDRKRWFRGRVLRLKGMREPSAVITHSEVTSQYLIEESRRVGEMLFRGLFEATGLSMGIVELLTDDLRLLAVNRALSERIGLPQSLVSGHTARELSLPPPWISDLLSRGRLCMALKKPVRFRARPPSSTDTASMPILACPIPNLRWARPLVAFIGESEIAERDEEAARASISGSI